MFEGASSSYNDVYRYVIIIKLSVNSTSNTRWDPKSPYRRSRWTHRDFSPVRLLTQGMTHAQRCFRRWLEEFLGKYIKMYKISKTIVPGVEATQKEIIISCYLWNTVPLFTWWQSHNLLPLNHVCIWNRIVKLRTNDTIIIIIMHWPPIS
jgi:hypothetical protein